MLDYKQILSQLQNTRLHAEADTLLRAARELSDTIRHGDLARWQAALANLPSITETESILTQDRVSVTCKTPLSTRHTCELNEALLGLCPWRKGPFHILGVDIDTEWRSDWKWQRLEKHISPLQNRRVLDVGCGSGYHVWRMLGAGANVVIGIDPGLLFNIQFLALQHYIQAPAAVVLPMRLEQFPSLQCFDTVFSMGVLYHRKEPLAHLQTLRALLVPQGELVLETLVIPTGERAILRPRERYARMRNVWQIPTTDTLCQWLDDSAFENINVISEATTSVQEQRQTKWMQFESLQQSLDPINTHLTVEGYPAPRRAIVIARKPA